MEKLKFKKLTNSELSKIHGGEWVKVDGEWIWIGDQVIDNRKASFDSAYASKKDHSLRSR